MEPSPYLAAVGLALLLSLGVLVYHPPISRFLRQRGVRLAGRVDGTTVLLVIVLLFDASALGLLVSSAFATH